MNTSPAISTAALARNDRGGLVVAKAPGVFADDRVLRMPPRLMPPAPLSTAIMATITKNRISAELQ